MAMTEKIMVLGSGELGKEVIISGQRLGRYMIAVDSYAGAPAMQVADASEVISMLDGDALAKIVEKHKPDIIVPEVEAIRTEKLQDFENQGIFVVPTAKATNLTMNRDAIRDLAAQDLGLPTAAYAYATDLETFRQVSRDIGFPNVVKPVMSSSGKGQSVVKSESDLEAAWTAAIQGARGDRAKVIVEAFIEFDLEITLLTVKQKSGHTLFVEPIGHRQERGDYQESWIPAQIGPEALAAAKDMAIKVTDALGGAGLFGVEFFIGEDKVYFSELSPRPHDTGMVTLISQNLSEFDLHMRAILGLPIPEIEFYGPSASHVILADKESSSPPRFLGAEKALEVSGTDLRFFGKPTTRKHRRMGVTLARGKDISQAREKAEAAAQKITLEY